MNVSFHTKNQQEMSTDMTEMSGILGKRAHFIARKNQTFERINE